MVTQSGGIVMDFTEWEEYAPMIRNAAIETPNLQRQFLDTVGTEIITSIRTYLDNFIGPGRRMPMTGSGHNYYDSFDHLISDEGANGKPQMIFGQIRSVDPRLGIYWKVVEGGSRPITNVPRRNIIAWAAAKFGNPALGKLVADHIRAEGIDPQGPLSRFFIFDGPPNFRVIGFTELSLTIIRKALQQYAQNFETILRRGRTQVIKRDPATGRFAKQI